MIASDKRGHAITQAGEDGGSRLARRAISALAWRAAMSEPCSFSIATKGAMTERAR